MSKGAEMLIETLGEGRVKTAYPDEIAGVAAGADVVVLTMDAGNHTHARAAAKAANLAVQIKPDIRFMLMVDGCDDDPRELDEIPRAAESLKTLAKMLSLAAFHRLDLDHQAMILVATGMGRRIGTQLSVPSWLVKRI